MKKLIHTIKTEYAQILATIVAIGVIIFGISCISTVQSPWESGIRLNRDQLRSQTEYYLSQVEIAYQELDRQDELKALLFDRLALFTQTGTFNPAGIIPTVVAILGIGAVTDNVRKRRTISKNNKEKP